MSDMPLSAAVQCARITEPTVERLQDLDKLPLEKLEAMREAVASAREIAWKMVETASQQGSAHGMSMEEIIKAEGERATEMLLIEEELSKRRAITLATTPKPKQPQAKAPTTTVPTPTGLAQVHHSQQDWHFALMSDTGLELEKAGLLHMNNKGEGALLAGKLTSAEAKEIQQQIDERKSILFILEEEIERRIDRKSSVLEQIEHDMTVHDQRRKTGEWGGDEAMPNIPVPLSAAQRRRQNKS